MSYNPILEYVFYRPGWAVSLDRFKQEVAFDDRRRFRSVRQKIARELRLRLRESGLFDKRIVWVDGDVTYEAVSDILKETFDHFVELGYLSYPTPAVHCNFEAS